MGVLRRLQPRSVDEPTDSTEPLAALMQRVGLGDQAAFADLYDAVAGRVYGTVLAVVRDPSQAEEVTQEVFVEVWRVAPRFDAARGSVGAWVATIAHRRAVDRVRSEQSARERADRVARQAEPPRDEVADSVVDDQQSAFDQARVRRALGRLTEAQRQSIELAYFSGYTYREVALVLGLPEGTIKTRIRDGMIRLRDELAPTEPTTSQPRVTGVTGR
jgi:RNA polymerase sigma-70 factor (ECF subfamily)